MSSTTMAELIKRQEAERQDLAAGVYLAWQSLKEREKELLNQFENKYENAPASIQENIDQTKEKFFAEWGSDGRLAALMEARQSKDRKKIAAQEKLAEQFEQYQSKDRDRGH